MTKLKFENVIAIFIFSIILIASYIRLYFGVDLTDESFYIALPYRFVLGNIPVIDEYSIYQSTGILTYVFYKIFFLINHGNDGIVLYSRHLYFISSTLLAWLVYKTLKTNMNWQLALLVASLCITYVPFNIMGLSYNTVAMLAFSAGLFFALLAIEQSNQSRYFIYSGFFFSVSTFAYPTFPLPILAFLVCLFFVNKKLKPMQNIVIGTLPILILLLIIFLFTGKNLLNVYNYSHQTGLTNRHLGLVNILVSNWVKSLPSVTFFFLSLFFLSIFNFFYLKKDLYSKAKYFLIPGSLFALIFPLVLAAFYLLKAYGTNNLVPWSYFFINFSLLAPFYILFAEKINFAKKVLYLVWVPSLVAGMVTGISSGNGFINCIVGLFPAFLATTIMLTLAYKNLINILMPPDLTKGIVPFAPYFILLMITSFLVMYRFSHVYRDAPIKNLETTISEGAYKHLHTSSQNAKVLYVVSNDIKHLTDVYHPQNIIFYPSFSGGYLLSNLMPETNSVWLFPRINNFLTLDFFQTRGAPPDVAFVIKPFLKLEHDPLLQYFDNSQYYVIKENSLYKIYLSKKLLN